MGWVTDGLLQRRIRAMKTSNVWAPILPHPPTVTLEPDPTALFFCAEDGVESDRFQGPRLATPMPSLGSISATPQRIETTSHSQSYPRLHNLSHIPTYSSRVRAACSDQWREGQPGVGQSRAAAVCGSAVDSLDSWAAHCDVVPRIGQPSYLLTRNPGIPRRFSSQFLVSGTKAVSGPRSAFTTARQRSRAVRSHARKNALDLNPEINIKISLYLRVR